MGAALRFKHTDVPRQPGERARLKVVQGPDQGAIYVLTSARATIGRGEENDVVVADLKTSRRHAELALSDTGWSVNDLGSANGIACNGRAVKGATLRSGDQIGLGSTVIEFLGSEAGTSVLRAPGFASVSSPATQAFVFPTAATSPTAPARAAGLSLAGLNVNPRLLLIAGAGAVAYFFLIPDPPKKKAQPKQEEKRDLASYLPAALNAADPALKAAETFFRAGFREFREGNYLRAKAQFETALQIAPNHALAGLYLQNCAKAIEDEVKWHLERGKKSLSSGRLGEARRHFSAVQRLLFRDQANPAYVEAKEQLAEVERQNKEPG